jgi:hypothetical protein
MENTETTKKSISSKIAVVIAILAIGAAGYFYYELYKMKQDPAAQARKEALDLVAKVSKLVVLPEGEVPTIATVSDPEALKSQSFFSGAVQGDKVLIYAEAKKAILYSVGQDKILEVAPLNIGQTSNAGVTTTNN